METIDRSTIAGRYRLLEQDGQGRAAPEGVVELYAAVDTQLERPVIVQVLAPEAAADPEKRRTFSRHQQIGSGIHHCSICAIYDIGEWDGRPFSVMERGATVPIESVSPRYVAQPDVAAALRWTREAAEALQCCRSEGLADWTFSYRAVRVDTDTGARLVLVEGLDEVEGHERQYTSSSPDGDAAALGGVLRVLLTGLPAYTGVGLAGITLPASVIALLEEMRPDRPGGLRTAMEVAEAVERVEANFVQPTEAYSLADGASVPANTAATLQLPLADAYPSSEQPTLATQIAPPLAQESGAGPYVTATAQPAQYSAPERNVAQSARSRKPLPLLAGLAGLALLALLFVAVASRGAAPVVSNQAASEPTAVAAVVAPSPSVPAAAKVPDLRGTTLEDANLIVESIGLHLAVGDPVHDATYPADTVALQQPEIGLEVGGGSTITVSLSLGPEPAPPAAEPPPPPAEDNGDEGDDKRKGNNDKGRGKKDR